VYRESATGHELSRINVEAKQARRVICNELFSASHNVFRGLKGSRFNFKQGRPAERDAVQQVDEAHR
jgi:hypothetical protein